MGKISFTSEKLVENASSLISAVVKAKPAAAKGKYVKSATLCSTMGPGVSLDVTIFTALATSCVTVPVLGLGISPRGPRILPSLPTERIMSGVAITAS